MITKAYTKVSQQNQDEQEAQNIELHYGPHLFTEQESRKKGKEKN